MTNTLTISQAAKASGLSVKTIRFYEEIGLLSPAPRLENGYRYYPDQRVDELKMLKQLRDLGFPLAEMKKLWRGCEGQKCHHSNDHIRSVIDQYLGVLQAKIDELTLLQTRLSRLRQHDDNQHCCDIFHQLLENSDRKEGEMEPCC